MTFEKFKLYKKLIVKDKFINKFAGNKIKMLVIGEITENCLNIKPVTGNVKSAVEILMEISETIYLNKFDLLLLNFLYKNFFIGSYKNIIPSVDRKLSHSEMLMAEFGLNKQIKNTARPKEFRLSGFLKKVFPIKYIIIIIPDFEADGAKQVIAINNKIPMQEKIAEIFCDIFNFLKIHIKNSENIATCIPEVAKI